MNRLERIAFICKYCDKKLGRIAIENHSEGVSKSEEQFLKALKILYSVDKKTANFYSEKYNFLISEE